MEITTIIGIVIAIVIMLFGIRLILKNLRRLYRHWMRICILILTARLRLFQGMYVLNCLKQKVQPLHALNQV